MTNRRDATLHRPTLERLRELLDGSSPRLSVYLPLETAVPQVKQNAVRHRQAVDEARRKLAALGVADAAAWTEGLAAIETDLGALPFPARGLAAFASPGRLNVFGLLREVEARVAVGDAFLLRPLLAAVQRDRTYRLLALSVNRVTLLEGDALGLRDAEAPGLPTSLEQALGSQLVGGTLQYRSGAQRGSAPVYHGHGGARDEREVDLDRFHLMLAQAVTELLKGRDEPLVLAADQIHQGPFRAVLRVRGLLAEGVSGSPDHLSADALHAQAWPLVERALAEQEREALAAYERARNRGKVVDVLDDVVSAAVRGRVHRLWIDAERSLPGRVDEETARVAPARGEDDLLDAMAAVVLRRGGEVRVVAPSLVPGGTGAAAELR